MNKAVLGLFLAFWAVLSPHYGFGADRPNSPLKTPPGFDPTRLSQPQKLYLTASFYSVESLKREGTWKRSKGRMANGRLFDENALTCATRLWPLGTTLKVTNEKTGKSVIVRVTDRIGKRFAKTRIDLSRKAFSLVAPVSQGIIPCKVEVIR